MELKLTISDAKAKRTYSKTVDTDIFSGKKIGEKVFGDNIELNGYELLITGGSDKAGFPMRKSIEGSARRKALLSGGVGVNIKRKGMKKRKSVIGNTIGANIAQVNLKVVKQGAKSIEEALGVKKEAPKEEKPKQEEKKEVKGEKKADKEEPKAK